MTLDYSNIEDVFPYYNYTGPSNSDWLTAMNDRDEQLNEIQKSKKLPVLYKLPFYTERDPLLEQKKVSTFRKIKNFFKRYFCCCF